MSLYKGSINTVIKMPAIMAKKLKIRASPKNRKTRCSAVAPMVFLIPISLILLEDAAVNRLIKLMQAIKAMPTATHISR
jgi:hypothetical protein